MGKGRRTKNQKIQAKSHTPIYKLPARTAYIAPVAKTRKVSADSGLFLYDPSLIKADLTKTAILAMLAMATIVAIYYFKLL